MATTNRTIRGGIALALAALLPSLACDTGLQPATRKAFAAVGLQILETELVRGDDGSRLDRRHAGFEEHRGPRKAARGRESLQVVRRAHPEPTTVTTDEIVLFSGAKQASEFLAAHGIEPGRGTRPGGTTPADLGLGWLTPPPPIATADDFTFHPEGPDLHAADDFLGHGEGHAGADDWGSGETPSVVRYVMNDALPLHASASFGSAVEMTMQRGDRVFVMPTAPAVAQGNVFVEVQAVDRAPYPVGWMPLHWLVVSPHGDAPVEINFKATYGLMAKLGRNLIEDTFYEGCDLYPTYPQDAVVGGAPELDDPASIPYAERYECGEYPIGTVESASRKHLTTYEFTTPGLHYELAGSTILHIDELEFEVPIKMYRLPWQTRETYSIRDMSSGWYQQFDDGSADVVEHSHYQKFAGDALVDEPARVHDTDVWFNVTWEPPASLDPVPGASAYFNLCWNLPGGRLEGETSDVNINIHSAGADSHVNGVYWGIVDFAPFRVCATAVLRATPDGPSGPDVYTTGEDAPPIQVELVRASLHDVSVTYTHPIELYGHFAGVHSLIIDYLEDFIGAIGQSEGITGLLFQAFLAERLEDALSGYLYDAATRLAEGLPDPETELHGACNRLMPASYREPTSRWYPLYQHCIEASQGADVTLFSNAIEHAESCHVPGTYARANDGSAWSSASDDHDVYYVPPDDDDPIGIDRPYWVSSCGVRATADTTVMSGYEDLLECAASVFNEGVNYQRSQTWIATQSQSRCLTPAVGLLCELYGESEDLEAMWSAELGFTPQLDGYTNFCNWYESLTMPDLPDYQAELPPDFD